MTLPRFPFGFVLSDGEHDPPTNEFAQVRLPGGLRYSFHRRAHGQIAVAEGRFAVVHGHAMDTVTPADQQSMLAERLLAAADDGEDAVLNVLRTTGGRWAVFIGDADGVQIYSDAHGCRSVYFHTARPVAASHAHLVQQVATGRTNHTDPPNPSLLWLWDATTYAEVRALLPNHRLDLSTRTTQRHWPRQRNELIDLAATERVAIVEEAWHAQMDHYAAQHPGLVVSLTGGSDSRVILAMSRKHLDQIDFFTYTTSEVGEDYWSRTLAQDAAIVGNISADLGISVRMIDARTREHLSPDDREVVRANTLGAHGAWLLPHYRKHFPGQRLHVRGNLLETGRSVLLRNGPPSTPETVLDFALNAQRKRKGVDLGQFEHDFAAGLDRFGYSRPMHGYHLLDLFYIEARMGRWYSELLNETDVAFESFMPFNTIEMIESALAWPVEDRLSGVLFHELINQNFPVLNFYGRNETRNLYEYMRDEGHLPAYSASGG